MLDSDDMMEPQRLERMCAALAANPGHVVCDDLQTFARNRRLERITMRPYDFRTLLTVNLMHAGIMFPVEAWRDAGGYPEEFTSGRQDWSFNLALGGAGWCGYNLHEPLYLYRREGHNRSIRNEHDQVRFAIQMKRTFPDLYQGRWSPMCCGRKSNSRSSTPSSARGMVSASASLAGAGEGLVKLRYVLNRSGEQGWTGPVTGRQYIVSSTLREVYVDALDVQGLLEKREHKMIVFELATPTVAPTPDLAGVAA